MLAPLVASNPLRFHAGGGPLDHGLGGILNFFATHECTSRCRGLLRPAAADDADMERRRARLRAKAGSQAYRLDGPADADADRADPTERPKGRHR